MKKILLSAAALFASTAVAASADLPVRAAPIMAAPVFTWTGFYVGANVGWGRADRDDRFGSLNNLRVPACSNPGAFTCIVANGSILPITPVTVPPTPAGTTVPVSIVGGLPGGVGFGGTGRGSRDGFVGGVQAGWNYQLTPGAGVVIGLEVDAQYAGFGRNRNDCTFGGCFGAGGGFVTAAPAVALSNDPAVLAAAPTGLVAPGYPAVGGVNVALFNNALARQERRRVDGFATARVRLGYAFDRLLVYATGGFAFVEHSNRGACFGCGGFANGAAVAVANPAFFGTTTPGVNFAAVPAITAANAVAPSVLPRPGNNDVGLALGAGLEYAFTNNLSAKVEGLWLTFSQGKQVPVSTPVGVTNVGAPVLGTIVSGGRNVSDFGLVRVGLNYKFGP